jgi:AraC-like DNA-binding protein
MTLFFFHLALAQMIMCSLILLPLWHKNQSIRLYILLMISGSGYVLGEIFSSQPDDSLIQWFAFITGNALPGVFWLVSLSVFSDHVVLKRWQYALASLTLIVPLSSKIMQLVFSFDLSSYEALYGLTKYGALLLELVLISHALVISAQQWRDDLVQERRYIRGGVITVSALYIFLVIIFEQIFKLQWAGLYLLQSVMAASLVISINFFLFRLRNSSLFETVIDNVIPISQIKKPSKELAGIIKAMVEEKLYQTDGITISSFAKHLSIHEYKLRQLINGELNYRNFNDFLNFYRIKEVSEKLVQKDFIQTPVLTLALESGFRSLSSFNKAFKETHSITPTQYRKKYQ